MFIYFVCQYQNITVTINVIVSLFTVYILLQYIV